MLILLLNISGQLLAWIFRETNCGPSGKALTFVPDELNRIQQIKNASNDVIAQYTYNGPGRVKQRDYLNGTQLVVDWDDNRRISSYKHQVTSTQQLIAGFEYAYDKEDNKKYEKRTHEAKGDVYGMDSIYRLTGVKYGVPSSELDPQKTYADYTTFDSKEDFTLDDVGNRKTVDKGSNNIDYYNYVNGQYTPDVLNRYTNINGNPYTYDSNGNLTNDGTYKYYYDYANRLAEVRLVSDNSLVAKYWYDATGRRVSKTNSAQETIKHYFDGLHVVQKINTNDVVLAYSIYGNEIVQMEVPAPSTQFPVAGLFYFHENETGSIYAVTNSAGNIVERYKYSAYGKPSFFDANGNSIAQSAIGNTILFNGYNYNQEIGTYEVGNTDFSHELGRALQDINAKKAAAAEAAAGDSGLSEGITLYVDPSIFQGSDVIIPEGPIIIDPDNIIGGQKEYKPPKSGFDLLFNTLFPVLPSQMEQARKEQRERQARQDFLDAIDAMILALENPELIKALEEEKQAEEALSSAIAELVADVATNKSDIETATKYYKGGAWYAKAIAVVAIAAFGVDAALSYVPGLGQEKTAAKIAAKGGRAVAKIARLAKKLKKAQEILEVHHLLPKAKKLKKFFASKGLDVEEFTVLLSRAKHRLKSGKGIHTLLGGNWNKVWEEWILRNPDATSGQILNQLKAMRKKFGI
ncbi:MAG: DUF2380 domain-containing protein [Planctomycetes bacterium]|nr:DUF2380 domain-containing protein [Planctomycetota bacterium]